MIFRAIYFWSIFNLDNHLFISQVDWINEIIDPINKHFNFDSFDYHKIIFIFTR